MIFSELVAQYSIKIIQIILQVIEYPFDFFSVRFVGVAKFVIFMKNARKKNKLRSKIRDA